MFQDRKCGTHLVKNLFATFNLAVFLIPTIPEGGSVGRRESMMSRAVCQIQVWLHPVSHDQSENALETKLAQDSLHQLSSIWGISLNHEDFLALATQLLALTAKC